MMHLDTDDNVMLDVTVTTRKRRSLLNFVLGHSPMQVVDISCKSFYVDDNYTVFLHADGSMWYVPHSELVEMFVSFQEEELPAGPEGETSAIPITRRSTRKPKSL